MSTIAGRRETEPRTSVENLRLLTERKFAIFPCKPRSKRPAILDWPNAATVDMTQIVAWAEEFEDCNWGIATGSKSGLFVLDVDRRPSSNGKLATDGFITIANWSAEHPETQNWLQTASIRTAHGTQFLFEYPISREIPNSAGALAPGIDVRGWHGYVMAPGSIHPDGPIYEWANEERIGPAPAWLLAKIQSVAHSPSITHRSGTMVNEYGEVKIGCGQRNAFLTSLAGTMRRRGMNQNAIEAALLIVNREQCEVPLPESEARTIADSVSRYEPGPPESKTAFQRPQTPAPTLHIGTPSDIPDPRSLSRDPVTFLVDALIPMNTVIVIAAEFNTGKTWLALKLAAEIKRGGSFIGRDVTRCEQVFVFDRENPLGVIQERLDAVYRENETIHKHWGMWLDEPPLLDHPLLLDFAGPNVVMIFDALIRFHTADENRPTEMAAVMACLRRLQSRGATIIVLHHRDKKLEAGYRGTAEIPAGADILFSLSKEEDELLVLRAVKNRVQVDQVVRFKADWDAATLIPCESDSVIDRRTLVAEVGDQIRRNPGIWQSRIIANLNAGRTQRVSRWRVQQILDQHEGSLWRGKHGANGTRTTYFDVFSYGPKKLLSTVDPNGHQPTTTGQPAGPPSTQTAALGTNEFDTSEEAAEPAAGGQRVLPLIPADVLRPYEGRSQQVGAPIRAACNADDQEDEGILV